MRFKITKIIIGALALTAACVEAEEWRLGRTKVSIAQVTTKDPAGEIEGKTTYLGEESLGLLRVADGEEIKCPMYCVIKFTGAGRYRISLTCRADGNHQIIDFDSSDSRYLVLNCTAGNLYVDAMTVEKTKAVKAGASQPASDKGAQGKELRPRKGRGSS